MLNGERVREARKRAGLSQAKLAASIGVTEHTVYRWERGSVQRLDYGTVQRLAERLGVDAEEIHPTNGSGPAELAPERDEARPHHSARTLGDGPDSGGT